MSASVNKVILIGNLGQDPELRQTGSGKPVCNFSLATNEGSGDNRRTEWHRIVVWDKLAETCAQYLKKGRTVYLEGRIQTRDYEDRDGNKRQTTEIVAYTVQFLGGGEERQQDGGSAGGGWGGGKPSGNQGGWGNR